MELVIGGAFQGKLTWALRHYGLTMDDVCDLAVCDPAPGYRCYRGRARNATATWRR